MKLDKIVTKIRWMITKMKPVLVNRRCRYIFFVVTSCTFWMLYLQTPANPENAILEKTEYNIDLRLLMTNLTPFSDQSQNVASKYAVYSSKCKIPDLDPYDPEILPYFKHKKYVKCRSKNLLTYVTKQNNTAILHINQSLLSEYSSDGVYCCYNTITRGQGFHLWKTIDNLVDVSSCTEVDNNVTLSADFVLVTCLNDRSRQVYKNAHAVITINEKVQQKMQQFEILNKDHLSVLLVGIDGISRANMMRSLPITYSYLKKRDWIELKGYNKIGDNTFPNLMGILTGMNETTVFDLCNPTISGLLDKCDMIWYDYSRLGFVTAYGEDQTELSAFNYLKTGFKDEPTDYYFRPYLVATENYLNRVYVDRMKYCTGPETAGERIFNLAREFTSTFNTFPNFGLFWMSSYNHDEVNAVSRMDEKIVDFLKDLNRTGILENSFVMFISDHGFRVGPITYTHTGWLEERLPFFYMSMPKRFTQKYPEKYQNLVTNTERLTTPYNVYMTLQDILVLSGKTYTVKKSRGCPQCKSLFHEIEKERACEDVGIEQHWCTCDAYITIPLTSTIATESAKFILSEIGKIRLNTGADFGQCVDFELKKIMSVGISNTNRASHKNMTHLLITFQTEPDAVFQGTVSIDMNMQVPVFKIEGSISRLDWYALHSWCTSHLILKKYCYCNNPLSYAFMYLKTLMKGIGNTFSVF